MKLEFGSDVELRRFYQCSESFSHPAKCHISLLKWIVDSFTKAGDTILDPMCGIGTTLIAATMGRSVIAIDLEQKFIDICHKNWEKLKMIGPELGYSFGKAQIICGDSRSLDILLSNADILNQVNRDSKIAILYLLLGQMDNSKALILEVFIPTNLIGSSPFQGMPVIPISFDDKIPFRYEEINDIPSDSSLFKECELLTSQLFTQDSFYISFMLRQGTMKRAKIASLFDKPLRRIKHPSANRTFLISTGEFSFDSAFSTAIFAPASKGSSFPNRKFLSTNEAVSQNSFRVGLGATGDRAEFSPIPICIAFPDNKWLSAFLTNNRNTLIPVLCPTGSGTESGFGLFWSYPKYLSALLTKLGYSGSSSSKLSLKSTLPRTENSSSPPDIRAFNEESFPTKGTDSLNTGQSRSAHKFIIQCRQCIIQPDARNLCEILENQVDKAIFSPPYSEIESGGGLNTKPRRSPNDQGGRSPNSPSQNKARYEHPDSINRMPYGVDTVVSSPPYGNRLSDSAVHDGDPQRMSYRQALDVIVSSPPYSGNSEPFASQKYLQIRKEIGRDPSKPSQQTEGYGENLSNIGNLKSETYLGEMAKVYAQCYKTLKPGGKAIIIVKPFIRNKQLVLLQEDTKKLMGKAGFVFQEGHYRILTQESFWRKIYKNKYPEAPVVDREYILVFGKPQI